MSIFRAVLLSAMFLAGCDDDDNRSDWAEKLGPIASNPMDATAWQFGPIISDKSFSIGMPPHPTQDGDSFTFTVGPGQEVDYVTAPLGSLAGKSSITFRVRIEGAGATLIGSPGRYCSGGVTAIVPYFAHKDNAWQKIGQRWWAPFASRIVSTDGEYAFEAPLSFESGWNSTVEGGTLAMFEDAKTNAYRVGFTVANCEGQGHGTVAEGGTVTVRVLDFRIS
jgi:hypothetical protein